MRHRSQILALSCVGLLACAPENFEQLEGEGRLEAAESAIELGGNTGPFKGQCEGYTSGGGQRVRGIVSMELLAWTATTQTYRATVSAENWKKNFG